MNPFEIQLADLGVRPELGRQHDLPQGPRLTLDKAKVKMKSTKVHFKNIDSLRFLAFLAIFSVHGVFTENQVVEGSVWFKIVSFVTSPGGYGVPFFFVCFVFIFCITNI